MRSHNLITLAFLLLVSLLLAAGNIWIAAKRSTIPLELHEVLAKKELRREKHPGHDDVHLLHFQSMRVLEVDRRLFDAVCEGERIEKPAWAQCLWHGDQRLQLTWSRDFAGMMRAMPLVLLILIVTAVASNCHFCGGRAEA